MTNEQAIIDRIARLNSQTWKDREVVRTEIGKLLSELLKALEQQPIAEERYQDLIEYFGDKAIAKCILEDREEFKKWLERIKWNVRKVDELARKLVKQPSDDCVSKQVVKEGMIKYGFHAPDMTVTEFVEDELPPVTPTHRMCKDCTKSKILNGFEGYSIVCSRFGRMAVNPDFYCADFEKRGNENEIN